jgi:hypothetical protein
MRRQLPDKVQLVSCGGLYDWQGVSKSPLTSFAAHGTGLAQCNIDVFNCTIIIPPMHILLWLYMIRDQHME